MLVGRTAGARSEGAPPLRPATSRRAVVLVSSGRGARRAGTTSRLGTLGVALLPLLVSGRTQRACRATEVVRGSGHRRAKRCQAAPALCVVLRHTEPRRAPAVRRSPRSRLWLAVVVVALAGAPVGSAAADECPPGTYPISEAALRQCDADQTALPEVRLQLRVAEQRLTVATGDSLVLARALDAQSVLVADLRRELRAASAWGPRWAWYLLGAGSAVVAGVVLALSL